MNEVATQYESMIKQFLSKKLQENALTVDQVKQVILATAEYSQSIQTSDDMSRVFEMLEQKFSELHELSENARYASLSQGRKELENMLVALSSDLMFQDMEKAQQVLHFADNPHATLQDFYIQFPEFQR